MAVRMGTAIGSALLSLGLVATGAAQRSIWTQATPLLEPYSEIAVAGLDDRIYVMGGYPASRRYVDTV